MTYKKIAREQEKLQQQISSLQNQLADYPEGKLICCHHNSHFKYYLSNGHTKEYIPKSNQQLAQKLAEKKYISNTLKHLTIQKKALDSYLKHYHQNMQEQNKLLNELPGYSKLLRSCFSPSSPELQEWMDSPYEHNPRHPENLIHKTSSGNLVRSKSEAMIAHFLYTHKIPFRYECALYLNGLVLYPDFTILHPDTGDLYYWEHFGMMDNPVYCKNMATKLHTYSQNSILPSINLILTCETQNEPLASETVIKTIEHYFL